LIGDAGVLRLLLSAVLAVGTALVVDRWTEARGFLPPGFERPWRRVLALLVLTAILFIGIFLPVGLVGMERPAPTPEDVSGPRIFLLQGLLLLSLVLWFVLGYAGADRRRLAAVFARQFGLHAGDPYAELGIGVLAGAVGWVVVILLMVAVVAAVWALGGEEYLPKAPPELIPLVAGLPILIRAAIGLTAGVVEELFFRGFLQARAGIALSTSLFVLAHLSYEQPFMLVGIAALSLLFAFLVRWRRTILPAIAAHAAFDLIQLLIVVPQVLKRLPDLTG
jgi:membrane protease YdiL (CAAX protease family)